MPDGHPGRAEYQKLLVNRGEEWISRAVGAFADRGVNADSTVLVGESFAESLINFAEEKNSDLIVIGGARDGFFGGHVIGSVTGALLHCSPIPVALAPRGYRRRPAGHHHRSHRGRPHPSRRGQPAAVRAHAGQRGGVADPDGVVGVGREPDGSRDRQGSPPDSGGRRRGEPRARRARTARCSRDRLTRRRRFDAGVRAQEAQLGRLGSVGGRLQPVRRTAPNLPRLDGGTHPGRHRRARHRRAARRVRRKARPDRPSRSWPPHVSPAADAGYGRGRRCRSDATPNTRAATSRSRSDPGGTSPRRWPGPAAVADHPAHRRRRGSPSAAWTGCNPAVPGRPAGWPPITSSGPWVAATPVSIGLAGTTTK